MAEQTFPPLLKTKLYIPQVRHAVVERPQLVAAINAGVQSALTLISAPAGFGKTTALVEWVKQTELPVAWVSLDEGDNDPARFFLYLISALRNTCSEAGTDLFALLQSFQPLAPQYMMAVLLNELGGIAESFVLVLDDFHLIHSLQIQSAIHFLLEHIPRSMHLIIATRADPSIPLARLRTQGEMVELRANDLRFSLIEARTFFQQTMQLSLCPEDIASLAGRTEGWIAGLQLAGLAMLRQIGSSDTRGIATFIESFSGNDRYILDYLVEEVLNRLPDEMHSFLLQTSILERICGPLCDAVTGLPEGSSQKLLERLERENLFTIPLDNRRVWYRYHHLFADLLRYHLVQQDKESFSVLHQRAAVWLAGQGSFPEAIPHALQGQDFEHAAQWIEADARKAIEKGEYASLKKWIETLPQTVLYSRPELLLQYAWAMTYLGDAMHLEQPLTAAEQLWQQQTNQARLGEVLILRAEFAATCGDGIRAADLAQQALTMLPEEDGYHRGMGWVYIGDAAILQGDAEKAQQALRMAKAVCEQSGNIIGARLATLTLAQVWLAQGKLPEAARLLEGIQSQTRSLPTYEGLMARLQLSMILREWNWLDEAEGMLRSVLESVEQTGQAMNFSMGYLYLAIILWEKGDMAGMQWAQAKHAHLADQIGGPRVQNLGAAIQAKLALLSGDIEAAQRWKEMPQWADEPTCFLNELYHLLLVRLLQRQGDEENREALLLLNTLETTARLQQRTGSLIEIGLLKALALEKGNDRGKAISALEESLELARPAGYQRLYLDEGQPFFNLLAKVLRQPSLSPELRQYAEQLGSFAAKYEDQDFGSDVQSAHPSLIEPLTPREVEILRMIAAGKSNGEIAAALYLAVSTVKRHINHIFGKLGVNTRAQAIALARDQNLV